jgi:glycosyltransferase involved in cell wall biosynthesis
MLIKAAMLADYPESGSKIDGGLQAVTKYLVDTLSMAPDIELHVINFRKDIKFEVVTRAPNFFHHALPLARLGTLTGFIRDQISLNACLDKIQPDLVHSQGGGHHGILATRCRFPSVVTIHGIHSREAAFLPDFRSRLRGRLEGWMSEHYCIRRGSHTILISPYVADYYGPKMRGRKYLIPNPVAPRFFGVSRQPNSRKILFAGRVYPLKGVKELIHAVSRLPDLGNVRVVIAGAVKDEAYFEELKADIATLGLAGKIEFPGILSNDELISELSECAFLILPSYQETAPMVIQEAMAAGVPVIASNICGIPYQVIEGETGFLVQPGNISLLAERMTALLSDNSRAIEFGNAARQIALKEYRSEEIARRTLEVYQKVLNE